MARKKRTIIVDGEPIKVTERDYALWVMVEDGDLSEAEADQWKQDIPSGTSIVETGRAVRGVGKWQQQSDEVGEVGDDAEESQTPEGDGRILRLDDVPVHQRIVTYMGIGMAALEDIDAVPPEYLELYAYGATRDTAARALIDDMPEAEQEAFRNVLSPQRLYEEILAYQFNIENTAADIDPQGNLMLRDGSVSSEQGHKFKLMMGPPDAENEPVWDAGVMALSSLLVGGVGVAVGAPAMLQAGQSATLPKAMALAGKITGRFPTAYKVGKGIAYAGSAVTLSSGSAGVIARSILEANTDPEDVKTLLDYTDQVLPGFQPNAYQFPFSPEDPLGFQYRTAVHGVVRGGAPTVQAPANLTGGLRGGDEGVLAAGPGGPDFSPYDAPGAPSAPLGAMMRDDLDQPSSFNPDGPISPDRRAQAEALDVEQQATADYEADPYIGVGRDYRSEIDLQRGLGGGRRRIETPGGGWQLPTSGTPMYHDSDVDAIFSKMTPQQLTQFQDRMVRARLVSPEAAPGRQPFFPGVAGFQTVSALEYVLELANRNGKHYLLMAEEMAKVGDERTAAEEAEDAAAESLANRVQFEPYVPQTYLAMDPAVARESVRTAVEKNLGRKVNAWELTLLAEQMIADDEEGYAASEEARVAEYQARTDAYSEGRLYEPIEVDNDLEVEGVDPEARMVERFREMFSAELERGERTEYVAENTQNLFASMDNAVNAIGR